MLTLLDYWLRWKKDSTIVFSTLACIVALLGLVLFLSGLFPLSAVHFIFFSALFGLACLYRPNWCFLLLVALLPFEIVNLAPESFGLMLRPYQWLFLLLALALGIRLLTRRNTWPLFPPHPIDILLGLIPIGAWISGLLAGDEGPRLAVIVTSFYTIYLLARVFFRTVKDVTLSAAVFCVSGLITLLLAFWQNIAFEFGGTVTSVMPGRPNGTFAEADWLGFFIGSLILIIMTVLDCALRKMVEEEGRFFPGVLFSVLTLIPLFVVLVMTVSRSAWLGIVFAIVAWAFAFVYRTGVTELRRLLQLTEILVISFIIALIVVIEVPLTRFDLLNRAESTATGLQEITVACDQSISLPEVIENTAALVGYGCRHIDLEVITSLQAEGLFITTVKRPDPNVEIRKAIYVKTWAELRAHPIFGIGWGNIGPILGTDGRGAALNASNVWLEVWLGAGLIGLIGLLGVFAWSGVEFFRRKNNASPEAALARTAFAVTILFLIFNLFNAGLLIGFVWVFFAALPVIFPKRIQSTSV